MTQGRSFIVPLWSAIFGSLAWISPFKLVGSLRPRSLQSPSFIDGWSLGHLALALLTLVIAAIGAGWAGIFSLSLLAYGGVRLFELLVYQINVLLFDEYRCRRDGKIYALHGYRRTVILLLHNYFEVLIWFAAAYILAERAGFVTIADGGVFGVLRQSLLFMVSFSGDIKGSGLGLFLILLQSGVGVLFTVVVLARFLSLLPTPATMDDAETEAAAGAAVEPRVDTRRRNA